MVDKINLEDYDFFMWEYEDQTKIKHYVFQEYIDRWIKIVGSRNSLNYFDCFGGCGAYFQDGQIYYGSPILAAEKAEENKRSLDRKVNIVIIEKEEENIENLKKIFSYKQLNIDPIFINGEFDKTINNILDNGKLAPTFFFIDPFGFKINYNTLKRVMSVQKSEIFLNFMFTRINQYLSAECIEDTLDNLFGCQEWREIIKLSGSNR